MMATAFSVRGLREISVGAGVAWHLRRRERGPRQLAAALQQPFLDIDRAGGGVHRSGLLW